MADKPLCLLALDGGGIRGLSELIILEEIMRRIKVDLDLDEDPLPADFFDLIGGTSTGGLIALLLGRASLSVPQARKEFVQISKTVFSVSRWIKKSKFDAKTLENEVKRVLKTHVNGSDGEDRMLDRNRTCKTFVCSVLQQDARSRGGPRLFRTYNVRENATFNCKIWEAGRATSAAPAYFDSIRIGDPGEEETYLDAGLGYNNPINQVLEEARRVFPGRKVACVVSIGTGAASVIKFPSSPKTSPLKLIDTLINMATEADSTAEATQKRIGSASNTYFRFNVDRGLSDIELEEWEHQPKVRTYTTGYLEQDVVSSQINQVVAAMLASKASAPGQNNAGAMVPVSRAGVSVVSEQLLLDATSGFNFSFTIEDLTAHIRLTVRPQIKRDKTHQNGTEWLDDVKGRGNHYEDRLLTNRERLEGTCEWFCGHPKFTGWLKDPTGLLLVSADPGCGKSVLARYLVEKVLPERFGSDAIICYFMFKDENASEQSATNAIRALLHRFLQSAVPTVDPFDPLLELRKLGSNDCTIRQLWNIFCKFVERHGLQQRVICVLDALDECNEKDLGVLVECLRFYSRTESEAKAKFLLTTRGFPPIINDFANFQSSVIHLAGENDKERSQIQKEITLVLEDRLAAFQAKRPNLESRTVNSIRTAIHDVSSEQRTYLWLHLMFLMLEKAYEISTSRWSELISKPPKSVNNAYEKLLRSVRPESREQVRVLLGLILATDRVLTLRELNVALTVRENIGKFSVEDKLCSDEIFKEWLRAECGFFITIFDDKAFLIHQTAKSFLLGLDADAFTVGDNDGRWQGSFTVPMSHSFMAECCTAYLSLGQFQDPQSQVIKDWSNLSRYVYGETDRRLDEAFPLLYYCRDNWHRHLKLCQKATSLSLDEDIGVDFSKAYFSLFLEQSWIEHPPWYDFMFPRLLSYPQDPEARARFPRAYNLARVAAMLGHVHLLRYAVETLGADPDPHNLSLRLRMFAFFSIDRMDPWFSLMHYAAESGSNLCLQYLHTRGCSPNWTTYFGKTPLHIAFEERHASTIKLLLQQGASPNVEDTNGRTPLYSFHDEYKSDLDVLNQKTIECIKILIDNGASPNTLHSTRDILIIHAAVAPEPCAQKLELVAGSLEKLTAAQLSSDPTFLGAYQQSFIRYLIKHQADIDPRNCLLTPLYRAAGRHNWNVAFLLHAGANPNSLNKDPNMGYSHTETPLMNAVSSNNKGAIRLLLKFGANVDQTNSEGWTAMSAAFAQTTTESLDILLDWGLDINIKTKDGKTPLHIACWRGGIDVVDRLIPLFDIEAVDDKGMTAFELLCLRSWVISDDEEDAKRILESLFNAGVQVKNGLHFASKSWWYRSKRDPRVLLDLILDYDGTSARVRDIQGALPLHWACAAGWLPESLIKDDLRHDVHAVDERGRTPLHYAIEYHNRWIEYCGIRFFPSKTTYSVANSLLLAGSNPNAADNKGVTPMSLAKKGSGTEDVFELLQSTQFF